MSPPLRAGDSEAIIGRGGHGVGAMLRGASHVSRWLAWIGGAMLLLCAILVSLDVVFRAAFKVTYFESFELSTYAFAIATAMGMSYALVSRAHIRIEVVYIMLSARKQAWLDVVAYLMLTVCAGVLLYWCGQVVLANYQSGARSNSSLALPLAIPQGIWLLGLAWFALLAALYSVYGLLKCLQGRWAEAHQTLGVASLEEEIEVSVSKGTKS
ncbi:MAG TPA: TRAP transporter small permease subunit [Ramlibacter sp.]|nr:TRAP transporter small permease subunit [Ramlibacter sp.]